MHDGIAQQIAASVPGLSYSLTAGGNVFVGFMPQTPDRCVAVYPNAGDEPDSRLPYDPVGFQVIARSEQGTWAIDAIRAIYKALHGLRNATLPDGTYAVYVLAESASPFSIGDDENGRVQYVMDFRAEALGEERQ